MISRLNAFADLFHSLSLAIAGRTIRIVAVACAAALASGLETIAAAALANKGNIVRD
jgi:hypothetical protein